MREFPLTSEARKRLRDVPAFADPEIRWLIAYEAWCGHVLVVRSFDHDPTDEDRRSIREKALEREESAHGTFVSAVCGAQAKQCVQTLLF